MKIKKQGLPVLWEEVEPLEINHALWQTNYRPYAFAKLAYIEHDALYLNMFVEEKNPKATYTQLNDPVYKDSCLECFINVAPELGDQYLNIEVNANGAMLMGFGSSRHNRQALEPDFAPFIFHNDKGWGFTLILPEDFLIHMFSRVSDTWKANFYKCGDETAEVHFLSWHVIETEKPDFHRPEWFGTMTVE